MTKKRRVYRPRFVGGKIMMQADLERLHKYTIGCRGHRRGRQLKAASIADHRRQPRHTTSRNSIGLMNLKRAQYLAHHEHHGVGVLAVKQIADRVALGLVILRHDYQSARYFVVGRDQG